MQAILPALVAVFIVWPAFAALDSSNKERVQQYLRELKQLPMGAEDYARVRSLTVKLVKIDMLHSHKHFQLALTKMGTGTVARAQIEALLARLIRIVKRSDLSPRQKRKAIKGMSYARLDRDYLSHVEWVSQQTPTPTPLPE